MTRIESELLPHSKLKVIKTSGAIIELHDNYIRHRECSEVSVLDEEGPMGEMWEKQFWDNDLVIDKDHIHAIEYFFDNEVEFYRIDISCLTNIVRIDFRDKSDVLIVMAQLLKWRYGK